ncbi:MAG: DUF4136 domain-containing protein [Thermodesulfobacteriota bacterium]
MRDQFTTAGRLILIAFILCLASCYGESGDDYEDYGLVLTAFDKETDFQANRTYALPNSVEVLPPEDDSGDSDHVYDSLILAEIESHMNAYGYVREEDPRTNPPDIYLTVSQSTTDYFYYWDYYSYGWWGTGWYWGYPCYDCYSTIEYAYSTGTIFINMVKTSEIDEENQVVPSIWFAALNGVLNAGKSVSSGIQSGINQAFSQSPYLRHPSATE